MSLTDSTSKKSYSNSYTKNKLKKLRKRLKKVLPSFDDIKKSIPSEILENLKKK